MDHSRGVMEQLAHAVNNAMRYVDDVAVKKHEEHRAPRPQATKATLPKNGERRVASATAVSLVEGMDLFVDTSGHVVNRAGVRVRPAHHAG